MTAKDVLCGMQVDTQSPAATSEYKGKTYYFCSMHCKKEFDKNPQKYSTQPKNKDGLIL